MTTPYTKYSAGTRSLGQISCHILEGAGIGLKFLTFAHGGADAPLWVTLISKPPGNHTLGQDILFVATP